MKLAIIGLPGAGKTTIFNALTRGDAPTGRSMGGRFDVLTAVVEVPDPRLERLAALFRPRKVTHARVTYTDVAGLQKGLGEAGGLGGGLLNHLAAADAFVHVVRAFESELFPHPDGAVDPARDLATLETELLLADLVAVEAKLERLAEGLRKGALKDKSAALAEKALFKRLHTALSEERPLRDLQLSREEQKALRGYGLLTLKPALIVINAGDDQEDVHLPQVHDNTQSVTLRGRLEAELAQLRDEDLELFMTEYDVTELGLDRVVRLSYDLLGLQSFFTVGEDEVRAWTVRRGATALEAAGAIHSDLARGFIRAEVVPQAELLQVGSLAAARTTGKLRLEGKQYLVQNGDIVHVKFNI